MFDPRRHAAALLAALLLAAPPALAAEPTLVAQIDDATPTPTAEAQPPLTDELPGDEEAGEEEEESEEGNGKGGGDEEPADPKPLPDTGIEAGLIALLGLGLVASGSGLRLTLGRDAV